MFEKMKWNLDQEGLQFGEWNFDDGITGKLHEAICGILESRMGVIFWECYPQLTTHYGDGDSIELNLSVDDDSGKPPLAEVNFPLEKILSDLIIDALEYSEEAPIALRRILENALVELGKREAMAP